MSDGKHGRPRGSSETSRPAIIAALLVFSVVVLLATISGAAEVYRWTDANGVVQFSDSKPAGQSAEAVQVNDVAPPPGAAASEPAAGTPDIVMYISPTCGYCIKADRYFKARGLGYRSIDITASEQGYASFKRRGGTGTPLIYIDDQRISGFSAARLDQLLAGK